MVSKMRWPAEAAVSFARDGFILTPAPLLSDAVVAALKERYVRLFAGDFETGSYPDEWHWREGISRAEATREICNGWKADRLVASVVTSAAIGELVCNLTGWSDARVGQDDCLWKPPGGTSVGYHTDGVYISEQFRPVEDNSITVWIALDDADAETGVVEYARGSHNWPPVSLAATSASFHGGANDQFRADAHAASPDGTLDVVALDVPRGYAVLHHQDVWHGSAPNVSTIRARRALGIHLVRGDVSFRPGEPFGDAAAAAGAPDYIYGRYKQRGSLALREDAFPITCGPRRSAFLDGYTATASVVELHAPAVADS